MKRWWFILLAVALGWFTPAHAFAHTRAVAYDVGPALEKVVLVAGITMDTDQGDNNDAVSLHKYLYCRDEPTDRLDPSGFDDISDTIDAAGAFDGLDLGQLAALKHQVQIRTTIALRSSAYQSYDYELNTESGAIPSRWFRAAQIVTGRLGVGAADSDLGNFGLLHPDTSEYLRDVNQLLFIWNTANFYKLSDGEEIPGLEGRRGRDLDYGLVKFEQNKVEGYTASYFAGKDPSAKKAVVSNINFLTATLKGAPAVRDALTKRFIDKGKLYSFDRLNDRIQLGYGVVDWVYNNTSPFDF